METVLTVALVVLGVVVFLKVTKVVLKVALVVVLALVVLSYLNGGSILPFTQQVISQTIGK